MLPHTTSRQAIKLISRFSIDFLHISLLIYQTSDISLSFGKENVGSRIFPRWEPGDDDGVEEKVWIPVGTFHLRDLIGVRSEVTMESLILITVTTYTH